MQNYDEAVQRLTDRIDIDPRDARALTEYLTVLLEYGRAKDADGLYMVVSQSGKEYLVDTREGVCECPDHRYREAHCKHLRRVEYVTGKRAIPAWVDRTAVDTQLGFHVKSSPVLATTDGGITVGSNESTEPLNNSRPTDCECMDSYISDDPLPCWACGREGFEIPNPEKATDPKK